LEVFAALKIQVEVFWVVALCGVAASVFRVKMDAARSSKRWYPTAVPQGVTSQKTST
jgi:hypothetical protein